MTETVGNGGKFVQNGRIDVFVVIAAETIWQWENANFLHHFPTDKHRQKFIVDNVNVLSNHNATCLLIDALVVPVRIQSGQSLRNEIVLQEKNILGVHHVGRTIDTIVSCIIISFSLIKILTIFDWMFIRLTCFEALDLWWWIDSGQRFR